jgi:hypothetical protein
MNAAFLSHSKKDEVSTSAIRRSPFRMIFGPKIVVIVRINKELLIILVGQINAEKFLLKGFNFLT